MLPQLYNDFLDGDQYHQDDVAVAGVGHPIPIGSAYSYIEKRDVPFGGSESTALDAVNFIAVDYEKAAARNISAIQDSIRRRLEHEESEAEKQSLTTVV